MVEKSEHKKPEWKTKVSPLLIPRDDDGFPIPQPPKPDSISINGREIPLIDYKAVTE